MRRRAVSHSMTVHSDPPAMNTHQISFPNSALCAATIVVAGFLCGCSTSARFSVEAGGLDGAPADSLSYRLAAGPALAGGAMSPVASERVLRDVRTALSGRGLFEAPEGLVPGMEIEVDLGRGHAIQKVLTYSVPVYLEGMSAASNTERPDRVGADTSRVPRKIGERDVTRIVTVYPKFLRLTARPMGPSGAVATRAPLWRIEVTNEDESEDLDAYARLMVAAAMDWVGRSTDAPVEVVVGSGDSRVAFIDRGISSPRNVAAGRGDGGRTAAQADG